MVVLKYWPNVEQGLHFLNFITFGGNYQEKNCRCGAGSDQLRRHDAEEGNCTWTWSEEGRTQSNGVDGVIGVVDGPLTRWVRESWHDWRHGFPRPKWRSAKGRERGEVRLFYGVLDIISGNNCDFHHPSFYLIQTTYVFDFCFKLFLKTIYTFLRYKQHFKGRF